MAVQDVAGHGFDVGIDERLHPLQALLLGLQNVFGMTGMFVFPALLGHAFGLKPVDIAYVYGMTFICCGICTILQSVGFLRLPIVQGPYAGSFAALLQVGHLPGAGLGAAYGSFFVASLIWCVLSLPIRGQSAVALIARYFKAPLIAGMMVLLIIIQIAGVSFPNWIGQPSSPGFPLVNILSGAVAVAVIASIIMWGGRRLRRAAILAGLAAGALCYVAFRPLPLAAVANAPFLVVPRAFPFGFAVRADFTLLFLVVLLAGSMGSMALYRTVANWGGVTVSSGRISEGVFGATLGAVAASLLGGFSTIAYPDNVGMLRATGVLSRYATLAAGLLLIVLGACVKFDMLLVIIPAPVIAAAATLLFGIVFMHGISLLAAVHWDDCALISAGLGFLVGLGGLFVPPAVLATMPPLVRLFLQQPVISGGLVLVVLYGLLSKRVA